MNASLYNVVRCCNFNCIYTKCTNNRGKKKKEIRKNWLGKEKNERSGKKEGKKRRGERTLRGGIVPLTSLTIHGVSRFIFGMENSNSFLPHQYRVVATNFCYNLLCLHSVNMNHFLCLSTSLFQ